MAKTALTTTDYRNFFAAYGLTDPIDLSKTANPGWELREKVETFAPHLIGGKAQSIGNGYIRFDQLKKAGAPVGRVFTDLARHDGVSDLSIYELALGLEKADLLRLPLGREAATLWQSLDSIRWDLLNNRGQNELAEYLDCHRSDAERRNALTILEEWAAKTPADFEGECGFDERILGTLLASKDPEIRQRFFALFQTALQTDGDDPLENFESFERDYRGVLATLRPQDLPMIQALLKNPNPRKAAFALLCAKKVLNKTQFIATCRKLLADRPVLASKPVYHCGRNGQTAVTLGELVTALVQNQKPAIRLADIGF